MPYGFLAGLLIQGVLVTLVLSSPRRPRWLASLAYRVAAAYNEAPFLFIWLVVLSSITTLFDDPLASPGNFVALALAALVIAGLGLIAWRGARAGPVVSDALNEALGTWQEGVDASPPATRRHRPPLLSILFMPFVFRPIGVERIRDLSYGPAGRAHLLDVYRARDHRGPSPVLLYFHGGGYYGGRKSVEARALLFRLASRGWVTISANYGLRPDAGFFDHLADAKRAIAWLRENASQLGVDPSAIVLAGSSAGGHLATMAARTQSDPRYQPGLADADTSVAAAVSLYGWYDGYYELGGISSVAGPLGHSASGAPPFFIAHGAKDSLAYVESARATVAHLRAASSNPVVYAELPGGQHAFDLFHSLRFSAVVDGVYRFAERVGRSG